MGRARSSPLGVGGDHRWPGEGLAPGRPWPIWALVVAAHLGGSACSSEGMDPLSEAGDGPFPTVVHEDMTLEPDRHGHGWQGELDFSFRNVSDETITVVTCGRNFSYRLERWTDGEWVATWESFDELCLDVPSLDLDPGGSHDRTISFFGGRPDGRTHPRFSIPDPEGVYRLVIQGAYWRYDYWAAPPGGEEVPFQYRVSGPFRVVVAR